MRVRAGILVVAMLMLIPNVTFAQTYARSGGGDSRVFVDINFFGMANSAAPEQTFAFPFTLFEEAAEISATYPKPARVRSFIGSDFLDIGGGVMFTRVLGAGISYTKTAYEDPAGLSATIPHPVFFDAHATGISETATELRREETAINLYLVVAPVRTDSVELRIYGGPSFFSYNADMVFDVAYTQTYSLLTTENSIAITDFETTDDVKGKNKGVGFNVGADVSWFFTRYFGIGGGVRFNKGKVTIAEEPMSELEQERVVGGTVAFLGLRFRFGG